MSTTSLMSYFDNFSSPTKSYTAGRVNRPPMGAALAPIKPTIREFVYTSFLRPAAPYTKIKSRRDGPPPSPARALFLANVNVLRYVCYMRSQFRLSSVCLSVCLSSVTLVHPTQAVELFGNFFSPYDRPGTLLFWCQKSLVGTPLSP